MVVEVPFERVEGAHLVLSTINGRRVLPGVVVLGVFRCFRETDIIGSTSLVSVVITANQSLNNKIQNIKFNARLSLVLVTFLTQLFSLKLVNKLTSLNVKITRRNQR